jgi:hypothetical protein
MKMKGHIQKDVNVLLTSASGGHKWLVLGPREGNPYSNYIGSLVGPMKGLYVADSFYVHGCREGLRSFGLSLRIDPADRL